MPGEDDTNKLISNANDETTITRFVLPREESLRRRLGLVKTALNLLQSSHPEVIGMTLYGSMVTGGAIESSDIDGFVFVEESTVVPSLTEEDWQWAEEEQKEYKRKRPEWSTSRGVSRVDLAVTHRYRSIFDDVLTTQGLTEEQIKDIRIRVISDEIIREEVNNAILSEKEFLKYREDTAAWDKLREELPYEQWPSWDERPEFPDLNFIDWKISALFHLEIGRGLKHYRTEVVRRLKEAGGIGELVWKQIISRTADLERHMRGSYYPHLYPATLDEAISYYKLGIR